MSQLFLFPSPPLQAGSSLSEPQATYAAVLKLRRASFTVYRVGRRQHLVRPPGRRARLMSGRDMVRLARGMVG